MNLYTILLVILIIALVCGLPQVGGNWHGSGYGFSGGIGVVLVILVIVLLLR